MNSSFLTTKGRAATRAWKNLRELKPSFRGDGTITAGNSSIISDGAAAVVVGSEAVASRSGVRPLARIVAAATSGGEPDDVFTAPVEAIRQVVAKGGRSLERNRPVRNQRSVRRANAGLHARAASCRPIA